MPHPLPILPAAPASPLPPRGLSSLTPSRPLSTLLPLLAVFYSFLLLAPEAEITLFGINLPSYRLAALLVAVPSAWMILRNKRGSPAALDIAVMLIGFWMVLSFMTNYGFETGFVRGSGILIDTALVYMIARASVRSPDELRRFLLLCLPGLIFAAVFLALESVSGQLLVRPAYSAIFGSVDAYTGGEAVGNLMLKGDFRLGLMRAYGPFSHPILAGAIMSGFLPLFYFSGLRSWPFLIGIGVGLSAFFSLSSAAFLALMLGFGAIVIYNLKPYFAKLSWWTIVTMLALLLAVIHVGSTNGIIPVIARLTLTPHTADYRRLIWDYGSDSVAKYPWFGLGYKPWERPYWMGESVDAHFLLLAMRHGIVVPVILLAAIVFSMIRLGLVLPLLPARERKFLIGINITMLVYLVVGQTVNFFGSSGLVFMSIVAFLATMVTWANNELHMQNQVRLMLNRTRFHLAPA